MKTLKYIFLLFSLSPLSIASSISMDLKKENGFFTIQIYLGSNSQKFEVQVDTTTSETWVPSVNSTLKVPKYDYKKSTTSKLTNKTFEIDDESGNVKGKAVYDSMKVGKFFLNRMGFVQVDQYEFGFHDYQGGKLGLGLKQEHGDEFSWVRMLKKSGIIKHEIFTFDNENKELIVGELPGSYNLKNYTTCNLTEIQDLDDKFRAGWVCEMTHILCGIDTESKSLETAISLDSRAIFDSGYEYISIPYRHLKTFKEKFMNKLFDDTCIDVKKNNDVFFVCDDDEHIPQSSIGFVIGGFAYIIPPEKLFKRIEDDKFEMLIRFHKENDDICTFGSPFMNYFSLSFDMENNKVGFYGGQKIDYSAEWDEYLVGETDYQKKEKIKNAIIIALLLGGILLLIVLIFILRSCRRAGLQKEEPTSLVKNEEGKEP